MNVKGEEYKSWNSRENLSVNQEKEFLKGPV